MRKDIESDLASLLKGISELDFEDSKIGKIDSDFGIIQHDFDTHLARTFEIKMEGKRYEYNFEKFKCINLQDIDYSYLFHTERSSWSMLFRAIPKKREEFFTLGEALSMILAYFELQYILFYDLGLKNKDEFDKLKVKFDKYIQNGTPAT